MNNDISRDLTSYINPKKEHALKKTGHIQAKTDDEKSRESYEVAQKYLGALGRTKVNLDKSTLDKRVSDSIDMLKKDPEYVQSYVDFCDSLQSAGYSLEDSVIGTDLIFEKLKDKQTYVS